MFKVSRLPQLQAYELTCFDVQTLRIQSQVLKNNPLKDTDVRFNPVLVPNSGVHAATPVVFVLAGFTGNSPFYFNAKFLETNAIQSIDLASQKGEAPQALYIFVDAITTWGGSQFINSPAVGNYEDYITQELVPAVQAEFKLDWNPSRVAVMGGSSGGYGALHLASKFPDTFGHCLAIAPDSFFEASLTPDLYAALPYWEKVGTGEKVLQDLKSGKIMKQKNWHSLLNAFGMCACYSPKAADTIEFNYPLESRTGKIITAVWSQILEHDPIYFLQKRIHNLQKLHSIYLDVGTKDNFHLQYGTRQIADILKQHHVVFEYSEFEGTHFEIGERRIDACRYLSTIWRG